MSRIQLDLKAFRAGFSLETEFATDGPWVGVVGPSGAGKSTLLDAVAGLVPSVGRIQVGDMVIQDTAEDLSLPVRQRRTGYVFQGEALFPHMTAKVNLSFGMTEREGSEGRRRFKEVVDVLDLGSVLEKNPTGLSGGERRRVALGRALLREPSILLLDEPLTGLDPGLRERVMDYLARTRENFATPALLVSHRLEDVLSMTDHVIVLENGCVAAGGTPHDLLAGSHRTALARLIGFENVFEADVLQVDPVGGTVLARIVGGPEVALPPGRVEAGSKVRVGLRAEDIILAVDHPGRTSARNLCRGTIRALTPRGATTLAEIDCGVPVVSRITPASATDLGLQPGSEVWFLFKVHSCHYLDPSREPVEPMKVAGEADV